MKELINKLSSDFEDFKVATKEFRDLAIPLGLSFAGIVIGFIGSMPEREKINLALDQRDNSAQVMQMCGEDLEFCTIDYVDRCLQAVREIGCIESETLPIFRVKNGE